MKILPHLLFIASLSPWRCLHWRQLNLSEWSLETSARQQLCHPECQPPWEPPRGGLRAPSAWMPRAGSPSPWWPLKVHWASGTASRTHSTEGERWSPRGGAAAKGPQTSSSRVKSAQAESLTMKGGKRRGPRAGSSPSAHLLHPRALRA